jgi:virulence factor
MIRVAVVGGGQIARKVYLPLLAATEQVELAALVEPDRQRREALDRAFRFRQALHSVEELPAGAADCAFLLTPEAVRGGPLTALLERGLDVLCEKPLSRDLGEAEALADLAERKNRILMVGFNRRFMPVYRQAKEFLAGQTVDFCRVWKQGANLINHTIHIVDVLRFFCGEAVEVQAAGKFEGDKETTAAALIRFDSGALGVFQTSANFGRRLEEMEADGKGFTVYVEAPHRAVLYRNGQETVYRPEQQTWYVQSEHQYGFVDQVRCFLEAVRTRRPPECSAADAVKTHRLVFDILGKMKANWGQP